MGNGICTYCGFPYREPCEGGEMVYRDGSSRACPSWNKRLDMIGGMTEKEAEDNQKYLAQFR